jgi:esterase
MIQLAYKQYGDPSSPPFLILHGLFGMLDNWQLHANRLSESYCVYALDLRNHGRSPHTEEMNYALMAADVALFCQEKGLEDIVLLGHSMGGKVAMQFAVAYPQLLRLLIVADIAPKAYSAKGHQKYFDAFRAIDFTQIESRKEAEEAFAQFEPNQGIRLFLLKNLEKAAVGYRLKCNLDAIEKAYPLIAGKVEVPYPINIPTCFLKGALSAYITPADEADIEALFLQAEFVTIPQAGHWLHAENPEVFYQELTRFLEQHKP